MRKQNSLRNTGLLLERESRAMRGSCFVFRYPNRFLTAAHCVTETAPGELSVLLPATDTFYDVEEIVRHPNADVAVLHVPGVSEDDITWPHYVLFDDNVWGVDFTSCGYVDVRKPTLRVFRGYVQRFFHHESFMGFRYAAAELSVGCPLGLSGAPVFNSEFQGRLYGVVAENVRTATEVETVLEVEKDNVIERTEQARVVHYGVAVWLPAIAEWLDRVVPPVTDEELNRRAVNQQGLEERPT